ncbi:T9SS type A sorting domain-containing protein [Fluviicola taffensis]|uniref:Secretion system C-terminal sorting domain-containing protein n=1 Tax=Fluviicola taffensis (strain DSM 16823 / NCIMB 13979 / RW262) TaxID=755732 RepID=F2IGA4_FLUTR|nr:T9SS type A sorting domain-containing protein [Fluviicola taffensis]AEA45770.1 hypothetical protein Fluta_3803 [Fluviicola taffensis DSM 16823]
MRKSLSLMKLTFLSVLFSIIYSYQANAQCTVTSSLGYTVSVSIVPQSIVVSSTDCPWGYNYNVNFSYNISITGPGAAAQYTLQAFIYCVNSQMNGAYSLPLNGGSGTGTTTTNPAIPHNGTAYGYNSPYVSCTAATVATLNCTSIDVLIQGPGIPTQTIHCNPPSPAPPINLPVEFLSFDGERTDSGNLLNWAVESQHRNDYFTLETSADGTNWSELSRVKGEISSTEIKTYTFLDIKNTQRSVYYKLSQTDIDGTRNELAIKYIPFGESDFRLYPNPSSDGSVFVSFSDKSESPVMLILRNEIGQIVLQQDLDPISKSGRIGYYNSNIHLQQSAGVYFVEVRNDEGVVNRSKLVIR